MKYPLLPVKILGQDDWLIFGRTADGTLIFTVTETSHRWLDAPHGGMHDCDCPEPNMSTCRVDNSWMLALIKRKPDEFYWRECDRDTDGKYLGWPESDDEVFMANSRKHYLAD